MAQFARPSSDVTTASWTPSTGATLWGVIDESTASDTDFIEGSGTTNDTCEVGLSAVTDPQVNTNHIVRYRYRKNASAGNSRDIRVELYQGGTLIAAGSTHTPTTATWTAGTFTLTGTQADAITDYSDLRLRITQSGSTGGNPNNRRQPQLSWAELEVPSATVIDNVPRGAYARTGGGVEILSTETLISNDDLVAITYQNTSLSNAEIRLRDHATSPTAVHTISVPAGQTETTVNPPAGFKLAAGIEIRMGGAL